MKFLTIFFSGIPPRALLLSSLKEVSKKGATVSTRWTPTRGNPWTPHDIKLAHVTLPVSPRPTLRAGGAGLTAAEKMKSIGPTAYRNKAYLAAGSGNVSPGLQGKAGSRGEWDGLPSIVGGGLGGKAPKSSSTRSKGWRLSWFFFRRRKKNSPPASCRTSSDERRIALRRTAGHLPTKEEYPSGKLPDTFRRKKNTPPAGCRNHQNHQPNQTFLLLLSAKEEGLSGCQAGTFPIQSIGQEVHPGFRGAILRLTGGDPFCLRSSV